MFLPDDTLENYKENSADNFNLLLNKFSIPKDLKLHKKDFSINNWGDVKYFIDNYYLTLLKNKNIDKIILKSDWHLAIGLGHPSVYETSITLHHIYGIPYIPASAIKGIVRSYFIQEEFNKIENAKWDEINVFEKVLETLNLKDDKEVAFNKFKKRFSAKNSKKENIEISENLYKYFYENEQLKNSAKEIIEKFRFYFGTQDKKGKVIFFDAFPIEKPTLELDIMNPHYGPYYSKDEKKCPDKDCPPADYYSPVPINFIIVKDTQFGFIYEFKENKENYTKNFEELFKKALTERGIGAKTAVGYGYMEKVESNNYFSKLEEDLNKKKEEEILKDMSELDKRLYKIKTEIDDKFQSSIKLFNEIDNHDGEDKIKIAKTLKEIWREFKKWEGKQSKKQKEKIKKIKSILQESD